MSTIKQVKKAFEVLFFGILNDRFSKQKWFNYYTEKDLLPCIRFFLLGYFESDFEPEVTTEHPYSYSGLGRFDFLIGDVAVEFAVRTPECYDKKLKKCDNEDEVGKLSRFKGPAALVLFDFSNEPLAESDLTEYREKPSLGKGVKARPFSLLYYYRDRDGNHQVIRKNIK